MKNPEGTTREIFKGTPKRVSKLSHWRASETISRETLGERFEGFFRKIFVKIPGAIPEGTSRFLNK